jgi:hypothetical protein
VSELADTPDVTRIVCPLCEPGADPVRELLTLRRCYAHVVELAGADDHRTPAGTISGGGAEAHGDACRAIQALIR